MAYRRIPRGAVTLSCTSLIPRYALLSHPVFSVAASSRLVHSYFKSKPSGRSRKMFNEELRWIGSNRDALTRRVEKLLTGEDFEKAVGLLVAAGGKGLVSDAAWNSVLGKEVLRGGPEKMFQLMNDAKKRGIKPDEHTYTILLRELSRSPSNKAVRYGMILYEKLKSPDSGVQCAITHTNAMLHICSSHGDVDTMWKVVSELPEQGPNAPNAITYTTILRTLRENGKILVKGLHPVRDSAEIAKKTRPVVQEARKIWAEVVAQWRKGNMLVDSKLVFMMASLLCWGGRRRDYFEVLALYEQTLQIERPPALMRIVEEASQRVAANKAAKGGRNDDNKSGISTEELFGNVTFDDPPSQPEPHVTRETTQDSSSAPCLKPSNHDLTLILRSCRHFAQGPSIGVTYWKMLTARDGQYRVVPDRLSYHEYLRLLRANHSSSLCLQIIRDEMVPKELAFTNTFVIAMSTCSRDKNNPNILNIAGSLLDLMPSTWAGSHPKPISAYLDLVRALTTLEKLYLDSMTKSSLSKNRRPTQIYKERLDNAVQHLLPHIEKLQNFVKSRNNKDATDEHMYGDEKEPLDYGALSPTAVADEAYNVLKRIAGLVKDLRSPAMAPLQSPIEAEAVDKLGVKLARFLQPRPGPDPWQDPEAEPSEEFQAHQTVTRSDAKYRSVKR